MTNEGKGKKKGRGRGGEEKTATLETKEVMSGFDKQTFSVITKRINCLLKKQSRDSWFVFEDGCSFRFTSALLISFGSFITVMLDVFFREVKVTHATGCHRRTELLDLQPNDLLVSLRKLLCLCNHVLPVEERSQFN